MIKQLISITLVAGLGLQLSASIPIPSDLRNPFEVPDPAGFKIAAKLAATSSKNAADSASAVREAAFTRVRDKLYSMPLRGIVSRMKSSSDGEVTVLLGAYTIKTGSELPASDFDIKGIVKVTSVTTEKIIVKVSIELETKDITISLAR